MLPSQVMLTLFEGSHPESDISIHTHPSRPSPCHLVLIIFTPLVLFHVDWWGIHQCPPSTDLLLSMTTHYPRTWSRNPLVPWSMQSSVAGSLTFGNRFTPLVPFQMTLGSVQPQHTHSHSLGCTRYLGTHHSHRWSPSHWLTGYLTAW